MNFHSLQYAAEIIKLGGVVAYPTEHCYGLGCDPMNTDAVRRILKIKRRPRYKGLILISDRIYRLNRFIYRLPEPHKTEILQSWPGPFTWLIPARSSVSRWLRGSHNSIALRVTSHREAKTLCRLTGMALVSTSANRSGRTVIKNYASVCRELGSEVDYVVEGGVGSAKSPSTIRDGLTGMTLRG